jgi:hypothetical protein
VVILEGPVGPQIKQIESMARYTGRLPGEHATHGIGMRSGENLVEGITSAPARFNTSEMNVFEGALKSTSDRAAQLGARVETRSVLRVEYRTTAKGEAPVLVGIEREAWLVVPGTDNTVTFARFSAEIDPVSRVVTGIRTKLVRPPR